MCGQDANCLEGKNVKKQIKSVVTLLIICLVVVAMLAVTNYVTAPYIEKNEQSAANEALLIVMPDGENFKTVDTSSYTLPGTIVEVYSEKNGGYVFKINTTGYGSNFVIMCGVLADGTVSGATCLSSNETLGYEKSYGENLVGKTSETIEEVATIAGATKTTEGYKNAVKDALNAYIILGGGSVDLRTDEEILNENLSLALPEANGEFTELFITEIIQNVDSIYTANNGSGSVYIIGESFVAVDSEGKVMSEVSDEIKNIIEAQATIINPSELTQIDLSNYEGIPSAITKAYTTSSGNFVFELKAAGYGINGDKYTSSGKYIIIKISLTADGTIISCKTLEQYETDGFGSACADKEFYSQFNGKNKSNYSEIDAISGATITTNGYKNAIAKAFEAVEILKGDISNEE